MLKKYHYDGKKKIDLKEFSTNENIDESKEKEIVKKMQENQKKMKKLQEKLYAQGKEGIIIVLQAMDAAGKDGTIRHVLGPLNPQGVEVTSFKQPSDEESSHDYLWRAHKAVPQRGKIGVFNRSYYEDVLVVKVHELEDHYKMANRCLYEEKEFFKKRYEQISNFEKYLYENSYRVIKIFLHLSKDEQKDRFLSRIDDKNKNWKFSSSDLKERVFFDEYSKAFETAFQNTATSHSPWYIVPADQKWYTRYIVSQIILDVLEDCKLEFPELPKEDIDALQECKKKLLEK